MREQRWSTQCPDDDTSFLAGLLIISNQEPQPTAQTLRPTAVSSQQQRPVAADANDDSSFLAGLVVTAKPASPSAIRQRRPAALRTKEQLRQQALSGYRFRTWFDYFLVKIERVLLIAIIGFFGWWVADGYGRDFVHSLRQPSQPPADLQAIAPGASAAELSAYLGESLPYIAPAEQHSPAELPDYLIPAHGFLLPPAPTPTTTPQPADLRPFRLIVPKLNLDSAVHEVFLESGVWQVAEYAAGYHHGTAFPGYGNTVLAGHAGLRGGVFRRLGELAAGDDMYLDAGSTRDHYRVRNSFNVWPHQVEVMYPTNEPIVTMITCTAWDTQRLVVVADLLDTAPLPPPEGEQAGKGETSP